MSNSKDVIKEGTASLVRQWDELREREAEANKQLALLEVRTKDETTDKTIRYVPFIDAGRLGFHIRSEDGSREQTVYLQPCSNEPLVWLHAAALEDDDSEPLTFVTGEVA